MPDQTRFYFTRREPRDQSWRKKAACLESFDPAFFPERGASTVRARTICASCQVWEECLREAVALNPQTGVWGGCTYRERVRVRAGSLTVDEVGRLLADVQERRGRR